MPFITINNFKKATELSNINLKGDIYKRPLSFFSKYEKNQLLAVKELLKDPEGFIKKHYQKNIFEDSYQFVSESPSCYHKTNTCPFLHSKYENYRIPEEIRQKEKDEVMKYRRWFKQQLEEYKNTDVIAFNHFTKWGITINPKIVYKNTGSEEIENYDLGQVEERIENLLLEENAYRKSDINRLIILSNYAQFSYAAKTGKFFPKEPRIQYIYTDEQIIAILLDFDEKFKQPLMHLLIEYFKLTINPDIELNGLLLEQLGFVPCQRCYSSKGSN